jgi:hypothetical protein
MDWTFTPTRDFSLFIGNRKRLKADLKTKSVQTICKKCLARSSE